MLRESLFGNSFETQHDCAIILFTRFKQLLPVPPIWKEKNKSNNVNDWNEFTLLPYEMTNKIATTKKITTGESKKIMPDPKNYSSQLH